MAPDCIFDREPFHIVLQPYDKNNNLIWNFSQIVKEFSVSLNIVNIPKQCSQSFDQILSIEVIICKVIPIFGTGSFEL